MDGKKRGSVQQTYNIRRDLVERMDRYRKEHGVMKVFLVERAIEEYLDRVAPEKGPKSAARMVSDSKGGWVVEPAGIGSDMEVTLQAMGAAAPANEGDGR